MSKIDTNVPIPKYYQIKQHILDDIRRGILRPGDMLPPERELAESYGVSRMTTRQAIHELVHEGLLYRIQGRGTYVASQKIEKEVTYFSSFSDEMVQRGFRPSSRTVSMTVKQPPLEVRAVVPELPLECYNLNRIRLADGLPMAIEHVYLPSKRFPGLETYDFESKSLYQVLRDDYHIQVGYVKHTIRVQRLTAEESSIFGVKGASGLLTVRLSYDTDDNLFEYANTLYHPERYEYVFTHYLNKDQ